MYSSVHGSGDSPQPSCAVQPEQQTYAVETEETAQRTVRRQTGEQCRIAVLCPDIATEQDRTPGQQDSRQQDRMEGLKCFKERRSYGRASLKTYLSFIDLFSNDHIIDCST